jgi:Leucine-rich repeat (LRR) protein
MDFTSSAWHQMISANSTSVKKLDLSGNAIKEVPTDIFACKLLTLLNLSHNQLSRLPSVVNWFEALECLQVQGNQLTDLPKELGSCSQLRRLDLSHNQLKHEHVNVVATLHHLRYLDIR